MKIVAAIILVTGIALLSAHKALPGPVKKRNYFTLQEILNQNGAWNLDSFRVGKFSYDFPENESHVTSACFAKTGKVILKWENEQLQLRVGSLHFDLGKMRMKPGGGALDSPIVADDYLYRFTAKGDTFSYFTAEYFMCNGSGCLDHLHFLINHRLHSINIWEVYGYFFEEHTFIADIDHDSVPDFLYPHFATWHGGAYTDTTEIFHLHPYACGSTGNYQPLIHDGKEVFYSYTADFQRESYANGAIVREPVK